MTPLIRERIKLLSDVVTVADFFFVSQLAPYDPAELIPQKGDAAMALRALECARTVLAKAEFTHDALEAALRDAVEGTRHQDRPDVPAHPRGGVRAQERAAAVRNAGGPGRDNQPGAHRPGHRKTEIMSDPSNTRTAEPEGAPAPAAPSNFVRDIILDDLKTGKFEGRVHTRFPPEPNGYLHIGHAKSICLNFGLAKEFGGKTNLRFDDTNPCKEETEYVESIIDNVRWLGFDWEDRLFYASDYFDQLYEWAVKMIKAGKAYVCDLTAEQVREYRGTLTEPGKESPYRNRTVEENLDLFERMRAGEFPDGARTLRAKIDMASPNLNMRDPVMYRILHAEHHRTGE